MQPERPFAYMLYGGGWKRSEQTLRARIKIGVGYIKEREVNFQVDRHTWMKEEACMTLTELLTS